MEVVDYYFEMDIATSIPSFPGQPFYLVWLVFLRPVYETDEGHDSRWWLLGLHHHYHPYWCDGLVCSEDTHHSHTVDGRRWPPTRFRIYSRLVPSNFLPAATRIGFFLAFLLSIYLFSILFVLSCFLFLFPGTWHIVDQLACWSSHIDHHTIL